MDSDYLTIDCSFFKKFLPALKDLLKYQFKVRIQLENNVLKIFGSKICLNNCKNLINYYRKADSQYLLAVNNYSKDALKIIDLILLFESKCKCLLFLEESTLNLYGNLTNINLLYHYFLKYDRLVGKENLEFVFSESENTQLDILCNQCDIHRPKCFGLKSGIFMYNILIDRDRLFDQILLDNLSSDFENIEVNDMKPNDYGASSSGVELLPYQIIIEPDKCQTLEDNCKSDKISLTKDNISKFRTIIIDGNNLAFGHGGDKFSCMGIKLAIDYFSSRGHTKIYAMLPRHRQPMGGQLFEKLERDNRLKYTPSRRLNNVRETPYDDRFILDAALATGGVVLSNDQYRDLMSVEKYIEIISNRLIPYTFIEDHLIIPDDPRGHNGPSLGIMLANPLSLNHQRSPRKNSQNKKKPQTPQKQLSKDVKNIAHAKRSQSQPRDIRGEQLHLYNQVNDIIPNEAKLIREVIFGNPKVSDPNTIINLVFMAMSRNKH